MFGDGLAFFATTHASHRDGPLHGFTDVFKGFGVVFDTFENTEPGHVHKDVLLLSSDGAASALPAKDATPTGCDAEVRFWEGRDDFSVFNHSAARISLRGNRVSVFVDARASGEWVACVRDVELAAPAGWQADGVYIGIIATTGDLADNHDVLSVQAGLGGEEEAAPNPFEPPAAGGGEGPAITTGNPAVDDAVAALVGRAAAATADRLTYIHHHMEHQLSALHDSTKATLRKLGEAEESNKRRIEELERKMAAKVADTVEGSIAERLARVEVALTAALDAKLAGSVLPALEASVGASSRGWLLPFIALSLTLVAAFAFAYTRYRQLRKQHLL
jgi:hypothetical protein